MVIRLLIVVAALVAVRSAAAKPARCPPPPEEVQLPNATSSGYLEIDDQGSKLFYLFYEANPEIAKNRSATPITLWLQGGPGCASLFGAFYELGPELVDGGLNLQPNPGAWNRRSALLFIDQPLGAGFSLPGTPGAIPRDEMTLAADLYAGLQAFFQRYPHLQERPLVIAGESYAGKYVPSIGHFILQQAAQPGRQLSARQLSTRRRQPTHHRPIPPHLLASRKLLDEPPLFRLAALAIGNGLTDPAAQVMTHADTAYFMGYLDPRQRLHAMALQLQTVQLISAEKWEEAHGLRTALLEHIRGSAGAATLLDMRRYEDYDAGKLVDCYLNLPEVKEALGADPDVHFESCSDEVGEALGPDVMKSVRHLLPDLLAEYPLLLYQGMWDVQDGPASSEAWVYSLEWEGRALFTGANRHIIRGKDIKEESITSSSSSSSSGSTIRAVDPSSGSSSFAADISSTAKQHLRLGDEEAAGGGSSQLRQLQGASVVAQQEQRIAQEAEEQQKQRTLDSRQQERRLQPASDPHKQRPDSDAQLVGTATLDKPHISPAGSATLDRQRDASGSRVVAYWKQGGGLTHVVLADAGHMVPRDAPLAMRWALERWMEEALEG